MDERVCYAIKDNTLVNDNYANSNVVAVNIWNLMQRGEESQMKWGLDYFLKEKHKPEFRTVMPVGGSIMLEGLSSIISFKDMISSFVPSSQDRPTAPGI